MTLVTQFILIYSIALICSMVSTIKAYSSSVCWYKSPILINLYAVGSWYLLITLEGFSYTYKSTSAMLILTMLVSGLNLLTCYIVYILCNIMDKTGCMPEGKQTKLYAVYDAITMFAPYVFKKAAPFVFVTLTTLSVIYAHEYNKFKSDEFTHTANINTKFKYRILYPAKIIVSKLNNA